MLKNYIKKLSKMQNLSPQKFNDVSLSMQRLDQNDATEELKHEDYSQDTNTSEIKTIKADNPEPAILTLKDDSVIILENVFRQDSSRPVFFIQKHFTSITCIAFFFALIFGFTLFLLSFINLVIRFSAAKPNNQYQYYNSMDNLTKSMLF